MKKLTKKEQFMNFLRNEKSKGIKTMKTSDIVCWGVVNFCISSERYAREFAQYGFFLKRLSSFEMKEYEKKCGHKVNQGVYKLI